MSTNESVFARYVADVPEPERAAPEIIRMGPAATTIPTAGPKAHPTEKFLDWLLNYWTKPTISLREICRYATPHAIRDWERAMTLVETLVQRGWLIRCPETHRRDHRVWEIARGQANKIPSATVSQKVAEDLSL
jgi:hypothetical protein